MQLYTFTARSLADALRIVRSELGPDASLLYTRELSSPLARLLGGRKIEVTASVEVEAPSRLPTRVPAAELQDFREQFRRNLKMADVAQPSIVEQMSQASRNRRA